MQPEHRHLSAVRVSGELQMHACFLGERPGVRLMGEQDRCRSFRPVAQSGAQVAAAGPRIVDAAQPDLVSAAAKRDAAVSQDLDARPRQLALHGVRPRPEVVVAEAREDAVIARQTAELLLQQ